MFGRLLNCVSRSHSQSAILPTRLDSSDSPVSYPVPTYSACKGIWVNPVYP
ncbi:MAG: CRISPR-associated protein Cas5 [Faecousia sp.]